MDQVGMLSTQMVDGEIDFATFVKKTRGYWEATARKVCRRDLPSWWGQEDALQEVLLRVWEVSQKYDKDRATSGAKGTMNPRMWLTLMAYQQTCKRANEARGLPQKATAKDLGRYERLLSARSDEETDEGYSIEDLAMEAPQDMDARMDLAPTLLPALESNGELIAYAALLRYGGDVEMAAAALWALPELARVARLGSREAAQLLVERTMIRIEEEAVLCTKLM